MGVFIWFEGSIVIIEGVVQLSVVFVIGIDFCVVVVMVLVGFFVKGIIEVVGLKYFDWGYDDFEVKFSVVGVEVKCNIF